MLTFTCFPLLLSILFLRNGLSLDREHTDWLDQLANKPPRSSFFILLKLAWLSYGWMLGIWTQVFRLAETHLPNSNFFLSFLLFKYCVGSRGSPGWKKSWVNVSFNMTMACQQLWDQLAPGEIVKTVTFMDQAQEKRWWFPLSWSMSVYEWLISVCRD